MEPQSQHGTINDTTTMDHCFHQHHNRSSSNRKENADELMILRALYLSQRRAEEAERKILVANKEKEKIAKLITEISTRVSAFRNWGRIMQMDSTMLEKRLKGIMRSRRKKRVHMAIISWEFGFCLLGFVGVGIILGRNMW